MVFFALGRKADSDAVLARMIEQHSNGYAFYIAEVYAFRGRPDEFMHWLERAYAQKDPWLFQITISWLMKSLETDTRYKALLEKMNLPE